MITLVCGRSRAGKTTYSKQFENVIHFDNGGPRHVSRHLKNETGDVVVDGIYAMAGDRKKLLSEYKGEGSRCIWLDTPFEVRKARCCLSHNAYREIPFEPPTYDEGWDEIIIIGED